MDLYHFVGCEFHFGRTLGNSATVSPNANFPLVFGLNNNDSANRSVFECVKEGTMNME